MKKQSLKKWVVLGLVTLGLTTSGTAFAASQTVYYRGNAGILGTWENSRSLVLFKSSEPYLSTLYNCKRRLVWMERQGTLAVANTWIAPRTHATAYWDCR